MKIPVRTKIICTMGPSVRPYPEILRLIDAGMNVARLNFSHGTHEEHKQTIDNLKNAREERNVPLAILLDTKGPEVRLGKMEEGKITLEDGQEWLLTVEEVMGTKERASLIPGMVISHIPVGATVLFDNGYLISQVIEKGEGWIKVKMVLGGEISSGKGVNIPGVQLNLPAVTERDIADIRFGCSQDIDAIAASFIRSADHVLRIRHLLEEEKKREILILAKIENQEGIEHFDSILQAADGIMVARGDLGVEVPPSQVPRLQKMMIRKCYIAGKPVVTATQMLETMITNTRPTRAETSDVANAIYDSTSAVMLSGETAVGKYPIKTVQVMHEIIEAAEADFDFRSFFDHHAKLLYHDVPSAVTLATVNTAYSSQAKAIFVFTLSGSTARLISRLRPSMPVLALTPNKKSYHQMALNWGVIPVHRNCTTLVEAFQEASAAAKELGIAQDGDLVIVTAGRPFGTAGTTNMMLVENIGNVLVRGVGRGEGRIQGKITILQTTTAKKPIQVRDQILLLTHCDEHYEPFVKESAAVVLENLLDDHASEAEAIRLADRYNLPLLLRADGALRVLKEGQLITLEPEKGVIYNGLIV
jgi:pyruvate kinase